jgi:hypothetical protein
MPRFADALTRWHTIEGLPSAFASARDSIDALLRDRGLRWTAADATEALARGAEASAKLARVSGPELVDLEQASLRLNGELLSLVAVVSRSPLQALARMHALSDLGAVETRGRPRPDDGVADALQALGRAMLEADDQPGLVVAALAHAEIAALAPFATANGLVARALERLLLVARGVDPGSCLVPEAGHLALLDDYEPSLRAYAEGTASGVGRWLSHAARAIVASTAASPLAARRP